MVTVARPDALKFPRDQEAPPHAASPPSRDHLRMKRRNLLTRAIGLCAWLTVIVIALAFLSRWRIEAGRRDAKRI